MEDIRLDILKQMDYATIRGVKYVEEYLRQHGGIIEPVSEKAGEKMYAIVFNYELGYNEEIRITGLRLNVNEMAPKGELELRLDYQDDEWVPLYGDIYVLPTIQSILEAIDQYE